MNVFEAQGIRKTYGETKAVDGVDLSLATGCLLYTSTLPTTR